MTVLLASTGGGGFSPEMTAIGLIALLGVGAQWLAWRLKVPSILLLLIAGLVAGPLARATFPGSEHTLDPNTLLDSELMFTLVGISVGLILYEGGLTLRFREVRTVKRTVVSLVTIGALVTWVIASGAALLIFSLPFELAVLLGAILVVTGPTVIGPMLGHIRPAGVTGPVLKWEGIVIDPIGVLLAVLVFEAILAGQTESGAFMPILLSLGETLVFGGGLGIAGAVVMLVLMSRFWVPDWLQNPVSLMLAVLVFVTANATQKESGLLATTVMGMVLANQKRADIRHILEFKESLRVLLIGVLFVVLASRVRMADLMSLELGSVVGFLAVLVVVARPAAVWISTLGTGLTVNERLFLSAMAPRGIVAAAGASIFAIGLEAAGVDGAERIVPITFAMIIGTVALYGLSASPIAKALGISDQDPQGVVFIGAPKWVREVARVLAKRGVRVLVIDTNRGNIRAARMDSIDAVHANILDEWVLDELDLRGIGRAFAATPNDEVNTLALQRFTHTFEKAGLYRLPPAPTKGPKKHAAGAVPPSGSPSTASSKDGSMPKSAPVAPASGTTKAGGTKTGVAIPPAKTREGENTPQAIGRRAFAKGADFSALESHVNAGWVVKATNVSEEFSYNDFRTLYGPAAIPLLVISGDEVIIGTVERGISPVAGDTVVALVNPDELLMPGMMMNDSSASEGG
ncbi:MAG: hypothetical protein DHS20C14_06060 [Phycisphaeraceae bacterium]|nr:MAG: hypothetical protein DHS20C14_06060 [Phycisphaeraceae bacterium]